MQFSTIVVDIPGTFKGSVENYPAGVDLNARRIAIYVDVELNRYIASYVEVLQHGNAVIPRQCCNTH